AGQNVITTKYCLPVFLAVGRTLCPPMSQPKVLIWLSVLRGVELQHAPQHASSCSRATVSRPYRQARCEHRGHLVQHRNRIVTRTYYIRPLGLDEVCWWREMASNRSLKFILFHL